MRAPTKLRWDGSFAAGMRERPALSCILGQGTPPLRRAPLKEIGSPNTQR